MTNKRRREDERYKPEPNQNTRVRRGSTEGDWSREGVQIGEEITTVTLREFDGSQVWVLGETNEGVGK